MSYNVASELLRLENKDHDLLYVDDDMKIKVWKDSEHSNPWGAIEKIIRCYVLGQFDLQKVLDVARTENINNLDGLVSDKLNGLQRRISLHLNSEEKTEIVFNLKGLFEPKKLDKVQLKAIYDRNKMVLGDNFLLNFEDLCICYEKGGAQYERDIVNSWIELGKNAKNLECKFDILCNDLKEYLKDDDLKPIRDSLVSNFVESVGNVDAFKRLKEAVLNVLVDKIKAEIDGKYRLSLTDAEVNIKDLVKLLDECDFKVIAEKVMSDLERKAQYTTILNRFDSYKENLVKEYGDSVSKFSVNFDLFRLFDGEKDLDKVLISIDKEFKGSYSEWAESTNRKKWNSGLCIRYDGKYSFLGLKNKDLPEDCFKLLSPASFEVNVSEFVQGRLIAYFSNEFKPFCEKFCTLVGIDKIDPVSSFQEEDVQGYERYQADLAIMASSELKRKYNVAGVVVEPKADAYLMGVSTNLNVLAALRNKYIPEIDERLKDSKIKRSDVFDLVIQEMAKNNRLDPNEVLNGKVALKGYSEDEMIKLIQSVVKAETTSIFSKIGRAFS